MPAVKRWCLLCVLLLCGIGRCAAEESKTPPDDAATINRILADWKSRWERLDRVTYRLEGTREYKAGSMTGAPGTPPGPVPPKTIRTPVERHVEFDFRNGRSRQEADRYLFGPQGEPTRYYAAWFFDGERYVDFAPRVRQHDIPRSVITTEIQYGFPRWTHVFEGIDPLAFAHGIVRISPKADDVSKPRDDPKSFKVLRRETFMGRPCTVLKDTTASENFPVEFWVDEERSSAVVLAKRYMEGQLRQSFEVEYADTEQGWMPKRWTETMWSRLEPFRPYQIEKLYLEETDANPELPIQRFHVKPEVGMVYRREGYEDDWVYQGEGVPPIEVVDYWMMKGWATKRSPRQKPLGEPPPVDPY